MRSDYIWKVRCSETGDLIGDCGCYWCQDEIEVDLDGYRYSDPWLDDFDDDEDDDDEWIAEEDEEDDDWE